MSEITKEFMLSKLKDTKQYCVCILKKGPDRNIPDAEQVQFEHGRRNFQLREDGNLLIVVPVPGESDVKGIGIFNCGNIEEVKKIMDDDPGVKRGFFVYELYLGFSFPGDKLI
jgi:hypothetical protein